ncbi:hypothetical protein [Halosimplex salinum]|uniref:hypothetical protein n=1 Tax=Halosimplex salinum TaxID=1710538 RepID=UPI000F46C72A|nr:hypothetical protein [Halosimplex salinum]
MGRTNPTYRDFLRRLEDDWRSFRRGLRRRSQSDFDRLFERARDHADAAGYANGTDPEFAFLLSVLVAQERELRELRERVDAVETDRGDGGDASPASVGAGTGTE